MNYLINCSNLKIGGGIQVADSFCSQLNRFPQHHFVVVLSSSLSSTKEKLAEFQHVEVFSYNMPNNLMTIITGRDRFMDNLVSGHCVDAVLTIFGPSRWCPKVPHLSGFAMAQLVILESPFYTRMTKMERIKSVNIHSNRVQISFGRRILLSVKDLKTSLGIGKCLPSPIIIIRYLIHPMHGRNLLFCQSSRVRHAFPSLIFIHIRILKYSLVWFDV